MFDLRNRIGLATLCITIMGCSANGGFPGGTGGGGGGGGGGGDLQPGDPVPTDFVCTSRRTGTATVGDATGNLCALGMVLDPVLEAAFGTSTCWIANPENAADGDETSFAALNFTAAALDPAVLGLPAGDPFEGNVTLTIDSAGGEGAVVAFDVELPGATLEVGILEAIVVRTLLGGAEQESTDGGNPVDLDVLGMGVLADRFTVGFIATMPFDAVQIQASANVLGANVGLAESESTLFVYDACSGVAPPPSDDGA